MKQWTVAINKKYQLPLKDKTNNA